ncbi:MAG: glycosyl hydrolase family 18 protein [Tepidiformaceae bacterium]
MTRRGGARQMPLGGRRQPGTFGSPRPRDLRGPVVLGLGLLAVVVVGWFILTRAFGGGGCDEPYCPSGQEIAPPEGFERVSKVFELRAGPTPVATGQKAQVSIPLDDKTADSRSLSFYRYVEEKDTWEPVAAAVLEPAGDRVSAVFRDTPQLIAVMRRLGSKWTVAAYLAHDAVLHHEAAGRVTIVHPLDFTPASDGTLEGELSAIQVEPGVSLIPVAYANASDRAAVPIVSSILSSAASRSNHVQQVVRTVNEKQLEGIDIAYLDLPATDRTSFTLFIAELGQALHAQSKKLTLTLPAPLKAQDRIDEGAYDWAELGKVADVLQVAPYRDQSTYRTNMPQILDHLTKLVQPSKLVLTVTPYASEKAAEGIRRLAVTEAMSIATKLGLGGSSSQKIETNSLLEVVGKNIDKSENLSGVLWDPQTATVAFTYKDNGGRTVWIENVFSVGFKLEYVSRHGLGGLAIEDASDNVYLGNIWPAIAPFLNGQALLLQPHPADLQPRWSAQKGQLEDTKKGLVKWTTPAEAGTYTVTLTLSDGVSQFENEIAVIVQPREARTPAASPTPR